MNLRKIVASFACGLILATGSVWLAAQGEGGRGAGTGTKPLLLNEFLYAAVPGRLNDIGYGGVGILVFDASRNFRFVKRIPTWNYPAAVPPADVRGIAASVPLNMIYVATNRQVAAWDITTEQKVWEKTMGADRPAITPDGKFLWVPVRGDGPNPHWFVLDAATGNLIKDVPTPDNGNTHNTIASLDGTKVFMAGLRARTMMVADTKTNTTIQTIGPVSNNIRPFTINGAGTLLYATEDNLLGYEVVDVKTNKLLQTVKVEGYGWSLDRLEGHGCPSHGIALSPDEREVWIVDAANSMVHVFDNTVTPAKQIKNIKTRDQSFWLTWAASGKWVYASSGDIIDPTTKQVIAGLKDETGRDVQGEKVLSIMHNALDGKAEKAGDQFGIGQVRANSN